MDIGVIGRNTQGVRIMGLDEGDSLTAIVRVPAEEQDDEAATAEAPTEPPSETPDGPAEE